MRVVLLFCLAVFVVAVHAQEAEGATAAVVEESKWTKSVESAKASLDVIGKILEETAVKVVGFAHGNIKVYVGEVHTITLIKCAVFFLFFLCHFPLFRRSGKQSGLVKLNKKKNNNQQQRRVDDVAAQDALNTSSDVVAARKWKTGLIRFPFSFEDVIITLAFPLVQLARIAHTSLGYSKILFWIAVILSFVPDVLLYIDSPIQKYYSFYSIACFSLPIFLRSEVKKKLHIKESWAKFILAALMAPFSSVQMSAEARLRDDDDDDEDEEEVVVVLKDETPAAPPVSFTENNNNNAVAAVETKPVFFVPAPESTVHLNGSSNAFTASASSFTAAANGNHVVEAPAAPAASDSFSPSFSSSSSIASSAPAAAAAATSEEEEESADEEISEHKVQDDESNNNNNNNDDGDSSVVEMEDDASNNNNNNNNHDDDDEEEEEELDHISGKRRFRDGEEEEEDEEKEEQVASPVSGEEDENMSEDDADDEKEDNNNNHNNNEDFVLQTSPNSSIKKPRIEEPTNDFASNGHGSSSPINID